MNYIIYILSYILIFTLFAIVFVSGTLFILNYTNYIRSHSFLMNFKKNNSKQCIKLKCKDYKSLYTECIIIVLCNNL